MIEWLLSLDAWQQALVGTLFTWGMTAWGAALVFFFKNINRNVLNLMLGFASGVMVAARSGYRGRRREWIDPLVSR
jgi:ZIP family zinc transporter